MMKKVVVKQVITEKSKEGLQQKFSQEKQQLEVECQQLQFEQRKLMNKLQTNKEAIKQRFEREINQRKDRKQMIDFTLEQLRELPLGSEIIEQEVDVLIPIEVGMNWEEMKQNKAIIVQDEIIVRIDE
ncbi:MAG TPA: YlqD family protein [Pseudogracilibacillus sp.]|nr:YlqD family protein [Pseudogracilibacillus sp.]